MATRIPKQKRSIEKFNGIIRTSFRIINEDKFSTTSTHIIAKGAGVGVGTIYDYFDSKDDILLAVLEYESSRFWCELEEKVYGWDINDPVGAMHEYFKFIINYGYKNTGFVKMAFGSIPDVIQMSPVERNLTRSESVFKSLLMKIDSNARPSIIDTNAFLLANAMLGVVLGIARGTPPTVDKESIIKELIVSTNIFINNVKEDCKIEFQS